MSGADILHILLGGLLVAVGVVAAGLADRIRGRRTARENTRARARAGAGRSRDARTPVVESAELGRAVAAPAKPWRTPKVQAGTEAEDVIAALVAAGHKKQTATDATWACSPVERVSIEDWTRAALRRCARGAAA